MADEQIILNSSTFKLAPPIRPPSILIRCRQNTKKYAHKFARHVYGNPGGVNKRKHNRIITFNYDTLIDDILIDEANLPARKLYFDRIKASQEETDIRRKSDIFPSPYMVKLHGSINWRIDSKTYEKIINGVFRRFLTQTLND